MSNVFAAPPIKYFKIFLGYRFRTRTRTRTLTLHLNPNPNPNPNPITDPNRNRNRNPKNERKQNDTWIKFNIELYLKVNFIGQA